MDDKEAELKAKKMKEMTDSIANTASESFEDWFETHNSSTKEERHEKLVKIINGAILMSHFMMFSVL